MKTQTEETKNIFAALIGAPNAGKSTLVNRLTQSKVSIVTPKVQTTRFRVRGIRCIGQTQWVLVDTPGVFAPTQRFDKAMVGAAWEGAAEADVLLVLVDALKGVDEHVRSVLAGLNANTPTCLVLTKVDALKDKEKLLLLAQELTALYAFDEVFMVSAEKDSGIAGLEAYLLRQAKPGPWFYPPDQLMDINERLFAAEITREHLFLQLRQELPYSLTVETEKWEESPTKGEKQGDVKIWQVIVVERESHKKIILGEKGAGIKRLGESARHQLGRLLGRTVHLFLHVKVREDWKTKAEHYQALGLNFDS